MDAIKLVIHHGGSWVGNCYEGGIIKWVNVPRGVSYEALVNLVEDVAKVDVARYNLQLWSLAYTIRGTAHPRIENDNDLSSCGSIPIVDPSVCNDETIDDQEYNQWPDTNSSDDSSISEVDRGSDDDEDCHHGVASGSGSVEGHGCIVLSGCATIIPGAERYSFEPISTEGAFSDDAQLYKCRIFQYKKDLKQTLNMYASNEQFEVRIRKSSKARYGSGSICLDANNQVFPLAYGFGNVEDEMSWTWFLSELKNAIGSPEDCMIISDHQLAIKAGMEKVYPNIPYGYYYKRKVVSLLFKHAWNAYRKFEFKEAMMEMMKFNKVAFEDLIPRWSRAYFPFRRYRLMTSSIIESMNSCLVHAHQMPITTMIDFIHHILQKWFYKSRTKAEKTRTQLTPWATELIKERNIDLEKYIVLPIDFVNFNVKDGNKDGLLNLSQKTCFEI
ncbi:hypothetical protein Ddye_023967 [Dipteronia dyeriana]|uniref:MULE transposase domain-containing protein n=1 Tax=Dipteronia dyeriana TaxID=168575 RepID=A0AAD9TU02_9ROSI|nr:hypothetical protein Ddye_023967 [Dipteronia dyeriana]